MSVLPEDLHRALIDVAGVPRLLVASDFDGTVAPIVSNPGDARPLPAAADALAALAALESTVTALISGRALRDLRTLSGAPADVHLVGSHGSEFDAGFAEAVDEARKALLAELERTMTALAQRYPGATVEIKPVSVAFHVRNAAPALAQQALDDALDAVRDWDIHITEGKAVREFAVIDTDKGAALAQLRGLNDANAVVFFGDDVTDEKAFRSLTDGDVGVKVGPGQTLARYRVDSPDDVAAALAVLAHARQR
ncbi:trehalose-phosphatase [Mycobacterium sp. CVI_P3]|uniref:Trehalose 6-phosphate phosphatase n=1 Tax=Mycobacterium pinniadriaticum TaxID=2994102 RepID=A0ABT3S8A8_9MYCO|nr:trehalose-phosphatase [Mycobacterium pinniadriaticum]MCX2928981.1 trehalose-phosphatase [Mycobacterium pinniadriaticum]MCX2935152.1 trehalose-phosphatase [Mycobacterium pinniadriaticum]